MNFIIAILLLFIVIGIIYLLVTRSITEDHDKDAIIKLYVQNDDIDGPRALSIFKNQTYKLLYKCFYKSGKLDLLQYRAVKHLQKNKERIANSYLDIIYSFILPTKTLYIGDRKIIIRDVNKMPCDVTRSFNRLVDMTRDLSNMYMHQVCADRLNIQDTKNIHIKQEDRVVKPNREGGDVGIDYSLA